MNRLLTSADVGDALGRSAAWVEAEARAGRIPGHRVGRRWRFAEADIDTYLASVRNTATARPIRRRRAS